MSVKWPWIPPQRKNNVYVKDLEGIESTNLLREVLSKAVVEQHESKKSSYYLMSKEEAVPVLENFLREDDTGVVPLTVIRAAASILKDPNELSAALCTKLVFSKPRPTCTKTDDEVRLFQKRMDRLRLRDEELRYMALTGNINKYTPDDVTVKSMTYAASVGLNMIVAPISFGVFMYFFAGQMFTWISPNSAVEIRPNDVDIRRVIAGVVSGVGMLFIEMTLFVIRTHTMDESSRKKSKRSKSKPPFGYAKPSAPAILSGSQQAS